MATVNIVVRLLTHFFVEHPVRNNTLAEMVALLEQATQEMAKKLPRVAHTPENYQKLVHIITLERWAQARLRVALGTPLVVDESDAYAPPTEAQSLADLMNVFWAARQDTLEIADAILQANPPASLKIFHNQYGPLSIKAWLRYISEHASIETEDQGTP